MKVARTARSRATERARRVSESRNSGAEAQRQANEYLRSQPDYQRNANRVRQVAQGGQNGTQRTPQGRTQRAPQGTVRTQNASTNRNVGNNMTTRNNSRSPYRVNSTNLSAQNIGQGGYNVNVNTRNNNSNVNVSAGRRARRERLNRENITQGAMKSSGSAWIDQRGRENAASRANRNRYVNKDIGQKWGH